MSQLGCSGPGRMALEEAQRPEELLGTGQVRASGCGRPASTWERANMTPPGDHEPRLPTYKPTVCSWDPSPPLEPSTETHSQTSGIQGLCLCLMDRNGLPWRPSPTPMPILECVSVCAVWPPTEATLQPLTLEARLMCSLGPPWRRPRPILRAAPRTCGYKVCPLAYGDLIQGLSFVTPGGASEGQFHVGPCARVAACQADRHSRSWSSTSWTSSGWIQTGPPRLSVWVSPALLVVRMRRGCSRLWLVAVASPGAQENTRCVAGAAERGPGAGAREGRVVGRDWGGAEGEEGQ